MSGRIPYSLLLLYNYLIGTDFKVRIVDERIDNLPLAIKNLGKDILCFGISSFTGIQIKNGLNIARQLKADHPAVPIVWGGWHPSSLPEQTLQHPLVDIVVRGQGEATFKELVLALDKGKDLCGIEGVSYKKNGIIVNNPDRPLLGVIENIRIPFEAVPVDKYIYKKPFAEQSERTIGIITSLGCPYNCGFCAVTGVYKRKVFFRNMDYVLEEIDYLVDRHKISSLTIDDDNFFVSVERVMKFSHALLGRPYRISWDAGVSADLLLSKYDDAALDIIKRSGCTQLYIGAESGSDEVLRMIGKKATVAHTYEFVKKMKDIGIRASFSSMVGLPVTSSNEVLETMDMILKCRSINPDFDYRLLYYTPYPATPLYSSALSMQMKEPASLEEWIGYTPRKFKAPWMDKSYRRLVKYFCYYYYPYSGDLKHIKHRRITKRIAEFIYHIIFENMIFKKLACLRVKHRYFKFPIDAAFVIQGVRFKSWYGRLVYRNVDKFAELDS